MTSSRIVLYIPRIITSIIFLQTLFFKFGIGGTQALDQSKHLFSTLSIMLFGSDEMEATLRIGTGIIELIVSILILIPSLALYSAFIGIGLMTGAILSHLFFIGVSFNGDGGVLMGMALIVLISCSKIVFDEKLQLIRLTNRSI